MHDNTGSAMGIEVRVSNATSAQDIAADLTRGLPQGMAGGLIFCDADVFGPEFVSALRSRSESRPFVGATSSGGVGTHLGSGKAAALWVGGAGVGFREAGGVDASSAVSGLASGDKAASPTAVFGFGHPGFEAAVVDRVRETFGEQVHVSGGGAADNDLSGRWAVFRSGASPAELGAERCVVGGLTWPGDITPTFTSGYLPTGKSGVATRVEDGVLLAINDRPAADVYDEWTDGGLAHATGESRVVLADTTLRPLAVSRHSVGSLPAYTLVHPERVLENGGLTLFARIDEGERVELMRATPAGLVSRGERIIGRAVDRRPPDSGPVAGSLIINCGGCMLAIRSEEARVLEGASAALHGAPFVMAYTFGELGNITPRCTSHGNLMMSASILGAPRQETS